MKILPPFINEAKKIQDELGVPFYFNEVDEIIKDYTNILIIIFRAGIIDDDKLHELMADVGVESDSN